MTRYMGRLNIHVVSNPAMPVATGVCRSHDLDDYAMSFGRQTLTVRTRRGRELWLWTRFTSGLRAGNNSGIIGVLPIAGSRLSQ
jgi:hypothetical protein